MAGFGKFILFGEYFSQQVVNILHYRSEDWLPGAGNPFDDVLAFVDAVLGKVKTDFLNCLTPDYTLLRAEGVGYDDAYNVVTASPLIRTVNEPGGSGASRETTGAIIAANILLRCGEQVQINGVVKSKRNRGYIALGPVPEVFTDNFGHLTTGYITGALDPCAQNLDDNITLITPAVTLIPIRIHEKRVGGLLVGRTYSDVNGYALPRRFGTRKSRAAEA